MVGDRVQAFNEWIRWAPVRIRTPDRALQLFDFFLRTTDAGLRGRIVHDDLELVAKAALDFDWRLGYEKGRAQFDQWWQARSERYRGQRFTPTARSTPSGFDVRCLIYSEGELVPWTCAIRADGTIGGWQRDSGHP